MVKLKSYRRKNSINFFQYHNYEYKNVPDNFIKFPLENQVFVSDEVFESDNAEFLTKLEVKEFKKIYSYLTRCAFHNKTKHNLHLKINEFLWRRNKNFEQLYFELKQFLGGSYET